jgi:uncharacterized protein YndB with AHSA1/START domain
MTLGIQKHDLTFTRIFDASLEQVWKAWSDSESVMQWWGPNGFTAPFAKMDFRVGGASHLCMSNPQFGDNYSLWHYQNIEPMSRIDFVHNLADKDGNKVDPAAVGMPPDFPADQPQTVLFKALGDNRTEITVIEYGWTVGQMMEMSRMGMEQCLDKMAALLAQE